jgi:hypothetical protein
VGRRGEAAVGRRMGSGGEGTGAAVVLEARWRR